MGEHFSLVSRLEMFYIIIVSIPPIHAQFKEVNNAKTILLNEKKRRIYDQYGSMGLKLAEQVGEQNLDLYMCLDSKLMKVHNM